MISINDFKNGSNKNIKNEAVEKSAETGVSALFAKLFESRSFTHYAHLRTDSYAQHKALEDYYSAVVDLVDELYETYAGQYGQIKFGLSGVTNRDEDPLKYLESLGKMLTEAHSYLNEKDTHLHNVLDEITGLTYRTVYKLKYLK
jgi:hypothetical protein